MAKSVTINLGGFLLPGLTLLFAAGKIWGQLDWSWLWVFSPLWIPFGILFLLAVFIAVIKAFVD